MSIARGRDSRAPQKNGELKPVRHWQDRESEAVAFMKENDISSSHLERTMDLMFYYFREHIVKKLFKDCSVFLKKTNRILYQYDIKVDWRVDREYPEALPFRVARWEYIKPLQMADLYDFFQLMQNELLDFPTISYQSRNQNAEHIFNHLLHSRRAVPKRDLLRALSKLIFELLLLYRYFHLPTYHTIYDCSSYVMEVAKEIAGTISFDSLSSRRGKEVNGEEWSPGLPTYPEIVAHFFACHLDNHIADRTNFKALPQLESVLQYGSGGSAVYNHSYKEARIVCEKERDRESYFYVLHHERRISTIPGSRSIFCAMVYFLNIAKQFRGREYRGVDLSEMIGEVIDKAKHQLLTDFNLFSIRPILN